ncbi:MAG: alpha-L-fucosidase [Armatimonadetes bacterium]|nr:alpha-L-fucosidase [Armatimonadota bacterium]
MAQQRFPRRAIHLDFHTMPGVYDVGRDFDGEAFARTLEEAGVDYITVFARCNLGFAYYPTDVGTAHPGLKTDLLGGMVEACHRRDIRVAAYINAGIDHEHALRHREWCKVNSQGQVYRYHQMGHFFRNMCLNTGYGGHLLAMVDEVLERYLIDGLFLDCFDQSACYGAECLDGMKASGMDPFDDRQAEAYAHNVIDGFLETVRKRVEGSGRDMYLYFNGISYRKQPTHIEMEILPTGGWGYDYLPSAIRYSRTLGRPYFTMTGRFHGSWGDFGGIRTEHSLLFDCYNSIANGGTCSVGDHMHPRGRLDPEVYRLIGRVYAKTGELDPWADGAVASADILVIDPYLARFPEAHFETAEPTLRSGVRGAARMLSELKYQFDISDGGMDFAGYKVIVLPDDIAVSGALKESLERHLANGGSIISSAYAGLTPEKTGFALEEYRLRYEGPEPFNRSFFEAAPPVSRDLPQMLTAIYNPGIAMSAEEGAEALARLYQPYFNLQEWDWYHENLYIPPEADSGRPALARCGPIFHFSFPVFGSYFENALVAYKTLVRNCLEAALPDPLVRASGLPSFGQATVTRQGSRRMVHLLAYVPEQRGGVAMIEEPILARHVEVRLRTDGAGIREVYLAPSRVHLDFEESGGYVRVAVPEVCGYQLVVFETER